MFFFAINLTLLEKNIHRDKSFLILVTSFSHTASQWLCCSLWHKQDVQADLQMFIEIEVRTADRQNELPLYTGWGQS